MKTQFCKFAVVVLVCLPSFASAEEEAKSFAEVWAEQRAEDEKESNARWAEIRDEQFRNEVLYQVDQSRRDQKELEREVEDLNNQLQSGER